jgi:chloramphenicol-sensitive protein RarD
VEIHEKRDQKAQRSECTAGVLYSFGAFTMWGFLPLYWKALVAVPSPRILAHRIFWSFISVLAVVLLKGRWKQTIEQMSARRTWLMCSVSAFFIGANWFVYVWAVNAGHVVESSMGYFINPLVYVLFGLVFFKEKPGFWKSFSLAFAFGGVLYMTAMYGRLPWIALTLAVTFGIYGLLRKIAKVDSLTGFFFETAILSPISITYLASGAVLKGGALGNTTFTTGFLLVFSGVVTATPIIFFAHGTRRILLSMVGFIQYLAPTLQLLLGIFIFKEPFGTDHRIGFGLIWFALLVFSLSHTPLMRRIEPGSKDTGR